MNDEAIGKALAHVLEKTKSGCWYSSGDRENYLIGAVEALSVAILSGTDVGAISKYPVGCSPLQRKY